MFDIGFFDVLNILTVVVCWGAATALFRLGSAGTVARMLAWLLVIEGLTLLTSGIPIELFNDEIIARYYGAVEGDTSISGLHVIQFVLHTLGDCAMLVLYPAFLAVALNTSLTRPLGTRPWRVSIWLLALATFLASQFAGDAGIMMLYASLTVLFSYALVVAIHAWMTAKPGIARKRAGYFAAAFGVRDLCWGIVYLDGIRLILVGVHGTLEEPEWPYWLYRYSTLVYVPIIAYGILRTQLFDIDLRIRWTLKQSTFAALVVAVAAVFSEGVEYFVSAELGETWGLAAAAVAILFFKPLQKIAERVVALLMPNTIATPEYTHSRKTEVYQSALEEALPGGISDKERSLLNRLRDSLGISEEDAAAIEREVNEAGLAHENLVPG